MILRLTLAERVLHSLHLLPTPVMDVFCGVLFGRSLALATRLGLFESLAAGALSSEQCATRTGLHPEAADLLLQSFTAAGYVHNKNGRYALSREGRKWLLAGSPSSLVHLIRYFETLLPRWERMETALREGNPAAPYYSGFTEKDWEEYALGMRDLARLLLPHVIGPLTSNHNARRLLDIGGSHGLYALESCRSLPHLSATIVDFPSALRTAEAASLESGLHNRITLLPGDFRSIALPDNQDVVLMFNIIHGLTANECASLTHRAHEALGPGGRLYILDQLQGEIGGSVLSRFIPLMVGLNLLNEIGGRSYSFEEVKGWCGEFRRVRRIRLRVPGVTLVEAMWR